MGIRNNDLIQFNAQMLLNKREVIESFEDFMDHHRQLDNEEGYSEGKRKVLLSLCERFLKNLHECTIPTLYRPLCCYEYYVTHDSIKLDLVQYDDVDFDADGNFEGGTCTTEYTLTEVVCDYLSAEQYAAVYDVTVTTVRQWIRRGKLRTARKAGREWQIPAIADAPKRGFESVTYRWEELPDEICDAFPFLADAKCISLQQDKNDKKVFRGITGWPWDEKRKTIDLSIQQREQLELMLIASEKVDVEEMEDGVRYFPGKRNSSIPLLPDRSDDLDCPYDTIIVVPNSEGNTWFYADRAPGDNFTNGEPDDYVLPITWEFWAIPNEDDVTFAEAMEDNLSNCVKLGEMSAQLILGMEMISDGHDPVAMCDDLDADLGYMMYHLTKENGPLNEETGDPYENVLYITHLTISEKLKNQNVGSRILRELPWLCKKIMHIKPGVLSYIVNAGMEEKDSAAIEHFYGKNGFQKICESLLMYAYTE